MAWLILRTAPQEPLAYWGRADRWVLKPPCQKPVDVLKPRVPVLARRFEDYDIAFDLAEHLRMTQPLAYGEVIAVVTEPEAA